MVEQKQRRSEGMMERKKEKPSDSKLRQRAEKKFDIDGGKIELLAEMSPEQMANQLHELQVHQIELKMQNDELRRIHEELEVSKNRYSHLYDFAPIGYFTVTEKGIIDEANLALAAMLGVARTVLPGQPFSRFVLKEDQNIFYEHRQQLLKTEVFQSCELRLVKKGGDTFYVRLESIVIKNREQDLRQIKAAVSDITERKASEDELASYRNHLTELVEQRTAELSVSSKKLKNKIDQGKKNKLFLEESEKRYKNLFNSVTDSVIIFDSQTRIFIDINKAASKLYGYTKEEFLQLTQNNITAEPENSETSIKKVITDGKINIPVRYHKKKDGTVFPVEITPGSFKIKNKDMVFGIVRDMTERLRSEEHVQRAEGRLRFLTRRLIDTREDECKRISLELHDAMGQALTAIGFNLSNIRNDISDSCQELLDDTVSIVDNMSDQVRNLSLDLRPSMLDDLGLIPT
ncbi:MAG: PAS domain S-box protein, partial [Desulfobacula sp.]|nr:PAS domain S-box protein [Desulfobacula sp.]